MLIFVGLITSTENVQNKIHWHGQKLTKANVAPMPKLVSFFTAVQPKFTAVSRSLLTFFVFHLQIKIRNKNLQSKCLLQTFWSFLKPASTEAGRYVRLLQVSTQFRLCLHFKLRFILSLSPPTSLKSQ